MAELTEYVGIGAGILTSVSLLPQLFKIIKAKKADDISYFMFCTLIIGLSGWIYYGLLKDDYPIILTNSFSVLVNLLIIIFTIKYKGDGSKS